VRSRAFLTTAAALAAALSAVPATAGAALAASGPRQAGPFPAAPGPVSGPGLGDTFDVLNNVCVAPWRLMGPLAENNEPTLYRVCDDDHVGGDGGVHVLDNVCIAPIQIDGPLSAGGPAPFAACNDETTAGGPKLGSVSALRNLSVLGAPITR
jgi:hypothetical protein